MTPSICVVLCLLASLYTSAAGKCQCNLYSCNYIQSVALVHVVVYSD